MELSRVGGVHEGKSLPWLVTSCIFGQYCPCVFPLQLHSRHAELCYQPIYVAYQSGRCQQFMPQSIQVALSPGSNPKVQSNRQPNPNSMSQTQSVDNDRVFRQSSTGSRSTLKVLHAYSYQTNNSSSISQRLLGPVPSQILNPVLKSLQRIPLHHHTLNNSPALGPSDLLGFHDPWSH